MNTGSPMPSREQQFFGCDTTESTCNGGGLTDDGFAFAGKDAIYIENGDSYTGTRGT